MSSISSRGFSLGFSYGLSCTWAYVGFWSNPSARGPPPNLENRSHSGRWLLPFCCVQSHGLYMTTDSGIRVGLGPWMMSKHWKIFEGNLWIRLSTFTKGTIGEQSKMDASVTRRALQTMFGWMKSLRERILSVAQTSVWSPAANSWIGAFSNPLRRT